MSLTTGHQALVRRIMTMTDKPNVVWPGGADKALPRYVIQAAGGSQQTVFRNKGMTDATAEIVVRIETDSNAADASSNDALVAKLVARFPVAAKFEGVTILDAPLPRPPLVTSGVYAVPVIIRGRFFF